MVSGLGSTMVFCRTRRGVDRLATQPSKLGITAAPIHGASRSEPCAAGRWGTADLEVATDVAAVATTTPGGRGDVRAPLGADDAVGATGVVEPAGEREALRPQRDVDIDVDLSVPSLDGIRGRPDTCSIAAPADRCIGVVRSFRRTFGFVDIGTGTDVFVHRQQVAGDLGAGDRVELSARSGRRGLQGVEVVAVAG